LLEIKAILSFCTHKHQTSPLGFCQFKERATSPAWESTLFVVVFTSFFEFQTTSTSF